MADKKDMFDLLQTLERLCMDYQAMRYFLDHPPNDEHWRRLLNNYRNVPAFSSQIQHMFDAVRDKFQSEKRDPFAPIVLSSLIESLNQITILESPK